MEWTLTHGFYTLMGRLALETNLCDEQFLPRAVTRMALTVESIKFLATHAPEMIPGLPPLSEIKDKSKANSASKVFACMQVFWFCLQCLERSLRQLPITLFEITTIAHCVYALIIHFLLWGKPFSVEEPTTRVVGGEKMSAIMSYMWMSSAIRCPYQDIRRELPEFESMRFCPDMVNREALPETVSFCHHSYNDLNYVRLQTSHLPSKTLPEHQKQILWKIAIINGLESMVYITAWNYSFSNGKGRVALRGCILFSFAPLWFLLGHYICRVHFTVAFLPSNTWILLSKDSSS